MKQYETVVHIKLGALGAYDARERVQRALDAYGFGAYTVWMPQERSQDASPSDHPRHKQRRGGRTRRVKV